MIPHSSYPHLEINSNLVCSFTVTVTMWYHTKCPMPLHDHFLTCFAPNLSF
jgi:hypothetical protein